MTESMGTRAVMFERPKAANYKTEAGIGHKRPYIEAAKFERGRIGENTRKIERKP